ncbi:MAG: molecular chaperone DnaK, partial [Halioglobus sp.]|nr:molecular chaperone DnaK [Halioglobus sp.]
KADDNDAVDAAATRRTDATSAVAQKMYTAQASAAENAAGGGAEQAQPAGDDVVDAEFEEVKDDKK